MGQRFLLCYRQIQHEAPDLPHHEVVAALNERMYRGRVPDEVLNKAKAEMRQRAAHGLPYETP
jgi:hypothetical protein